MAREVRGKPFKYLGIAIKIHVIHLPGDVNLGTPASNTHRPCRIHRRTESMQNKWRPSKRHQWKSVVRKFN